MTQAQQNDYLEEATLAHKELAEQGEELAQAQGTIRIALFLIVLLLVCCGLCYVLTVIHLV